MNTKSNSTKTKLLKPILLGLITLVTLNFFNSLNAQNMKVTQAQSSPLPEGFVYLEKVDPTIIQNPLYATTENFIGRQLPGYMASRIILTKQAAEALRKVQAEFKTLGYSLVIYDGYRPQQTVDFFVEWAKDLSDQSKKDFYYPTIDKRDLFELKYISDKSSHTRGSTVDLTLIKLTDSLKPITVSYRNLHTGERIPFLDDGTVDMGSSFDLFHPASHHDTTLVEESYTKNRNLLREKMKKHGFNDYPEEWWHYTLANEPFPDTYFNFPVK